MFRNRCECYRLKHSALFRRYTCLKHHPLHQRISTISTLDVCKKGIYYSPVWDLTKAAEGDKPAKNTLCYSYVVGKVWAQHQAIHQLSRMHIRPIIWWASIIFTCFSIAFSISHYLTHYYLQNHVTEGDANHKRHITAIYWIHRVYHVLITSTTCATISN
jgi:hypothetical protein